MVTTGFSRIHVAKYENSGGVNSYTGCRELARAKSMSTDITTTEENKFYANNQLAKHGYNQTQLEKMAGLNLWRVLKVADEARAV